VTGWRSVICLLERRRGHWHFVSRPVSFAGNAKVNDRSRYAAQVTLLIEQADGSTVPSGWSTRREAGGDGKPFVFQPGKNLIPGWTQGVLQMREGERALIHVPPELGYGGSDQGSKGSGWFIPKNSHLLFDIQIVSKEGAKGPAREEL
jgi:hypothetical protein